MKRTVYFVTPGETYTGQNPGLTPVGIEQVRSQRYKLPKEFGQAISGTGRRQFDMAAALEVPGKAIRWTKSVGGPESVEAGQVVLAHGTPIPLSSYATTDDGRASLLEVLKTAPNGSVILSDSLHVGMLGVQNPQPAAVYRVSWNCADRNAVPRDLTVEEVKATG